MQRSNVPGFSLPGYPHPANVRALDAAILPFTRACSRNGMRLDIAGMAALSKKFDSNMQRIDEEISGMLPAGFLEKFTHETFNVDSGDQVAELLFDALEIGKGKQLKTTASGDRISTGKKQLELLRKEHPVIPLILDYRENAKLKSTYSDALPRIALCHPKGRCCPICDRRHYTEEYRVHPEITTTRTSTGRMACKSPNLQNVSTRTELGREIRAQFIAGDGRKLAGCDFCLHPDTSIWTLDGHRSLGSLRPGDKVLTYRKDYIRYGKVTRSKAVSPLPSYRLTFDNGESVIASSQHRWPVHTGGQIGEKTTAQLEIGESMVACREGRSGKYPTWYSKGAYWYVKQHLLVAEAYMGPRPKGYHTHHIDGDIDNNSPSNLEYREKHIHWSEHSKINYAKQDHTLRLKRLREGLKRRRSYVGQENPNAKLGAADYSKIIRLYESGYTASEIAPLFDICYGYARQIIRQHLGEWRAKKAPKNHKLVAKEYVGFQAMHAITVEPDHNYVLSCGVVTHNSQIELRLLAHCADETSMIRIFHQPDADIHTETAMDVFGLPREKIDPIRHRLPVKNVGFMCLYGATAVGLQLQLALSGLYWTLEECEAFIEQWFGKRPRVRGFMNEQFYHVRRYGYCWELGGRIRLVPEVRSSVSKVIEAGLRQAGNHRIQGTAATLMKLAMIAMTRETELRWREGGVDAVPLMTIHDELLYEVEEDEAEDVARAISRTMDRVVELRVPVRSDYKVSERWVKG